MYELWDEWIYFFLLLAQLLLSIYIFIYLYIFSLCRRRCWCCCWLPLVLLIFYLVFFSLVFSNGFDIVILFIFIGTSWTTHIRFTCHRCSREGFQLIKCNEWPPLVTWHLHICVCVCVCAGHVYRRCFFISISLALILTHNRSFSLH